MQTAPSNDPVLNQELLNRYRRRSSSLLGRLIEAFLEECPTLFQNLRESVQLFDHELVRMNAHTLRSSSHNLGAVRLATLFQELEDASDARNEGLVARTKITLGSEFFAAEQALRGELVQEQRRSQLTMA